MNPQQLDEAVRAALRHQREGRPDAAERICRDVVASRPDHADAWYLLGVLLISASRAAEAAEAFNRAVSIVPGLADGWSNLGYCLIETNDLHGAEAACRHAMQLKPDHATAHANLGNALQRQGRGDEAVAAFRQAIDLNPHLRVAHANLLLTLNYLPAHTPQDVYAEHVRWGQRHANGLGNDAPPHDNDRDPNRRLRVGYVSPDFRQHSVAFFLEPLLEAHDRGQVEIFCYSDTRQPDETTRRIRGVADQWRDCAGLRDDVFAANVRQDQIDVLVDLAGHTGGNRLLAFARRPAPVQITYLGYPNTTALDAMQYRITDAWADPVGITDAFHTEQLIRLPRTAWCYHPPADAPPQVSPPPFAASGHVTFGSFNKHAKISSLTLGTWAELLRCVPTSRLIIKSTSLSDRILRQRLTDQFVARGINASRVELLGPTKTLAEHLSTYARIDLALDTFPYHGTTTTCDALYCGVPVVTQAGQVHVSRVGVSLLHAVGLEDLVAQTPQEYVEIAAKLAQDRERLSRLRKELRRDMQASPLMDARGLAKEIETAYRQAWQRWCTAGT